MSRLVRLTGGAAVFILVFMTSTIEAESIDPETISQVSRAIAEWKVMNEDAAGGREVYVTSSLTPKVERSLKTGINAVHGLSAFGQDYASMELELQRMRSYDFKTNITFVPLSELDRALKAERTAKMRFDRMRINRISRPQTSFPEAAAVQDLRRKGLGAAYWTMPASSLSNNLVLPGQQYAVTKHDVHRGYWHPGIFSDRFSSNALAKSNLPADFRKFYIINTRDKTISFYDARYPINLSKDWMVAGGITVTDRKSYTWGVADWVVHNRKMEAAKYLPRSARLDRVVRLETAFQYEDAVKMQFDRLSRWDSYVGVDSSLTGTRFRGLSTIDNIDPFRVGIPMGRWDRRLYNRIGGGVGHISSLPRYTLPRPSYSPRGLK